MSEVTHWEFQRHNPSLIDINADGSGKQRNRNDQPVRTFAANEKTMGSAERTINNLDLRAGLKEGMRRYRQTRLFDRLEQINLALLDRHRSGAETDYLPHAGNTHNGKSVRQGEVTKSVGRNQR